MNFLSVCEHCGEVHPSRRCNVVNRSDAPVEREPHNGTYDGTAAVKVVPPGFTFDYPVLVRGAAEKARLSRIGRCGARARWKR